MARRAERPAPRPTRRELIAGGAGATLWAALGSPPAAATAGSPPAAATAGDQELLSQALEAERLVAWGFERVLSQGSLSQSARTVVSGLLGRVQAHVRTLEAALGRAPGPPLSDQEANAALSKHQVPDSPSDLHTQRHCVRLLVDLESVAEGMWFKAIGRLRDPALARLGAEIMAADAQHWTVLSGISHPGLPNISVPYPFVRGTQ